MKSSMLIFVYILFSTNAGPINPFSLNKCALLDTQNMLAIRMHQEYPCDHCVKNVHYWQKKVSNMRIFREQIVQCHHKWFDEIKRTCEYMVDFEFGHIKYADTHINDSNCFWIKRKAKSRWKSLSDLPKGLLWPELWRAFFMDLGRCLSRKWFCLEIIRIRVRRISITCL